MTASLNFIAPSALSGYNPITVNGRVYSGTEASIVAVDSRDAPLLAANGWTLANPVASAPRSVFTATIANGASLSGAVDLGNTTAARLGTPATITVATNATLSFQASHDGVTYKDLYDEYGNEYTVAAGKLAASRSYKLPLVDFMSIRYLKVRTGTSGTPQTQAQDTDISITAVA